MWLLLSTHQHSRGRARRPMSSLPLSSPEVDGRAFSEAAAALAPDLPLLMFGSGDVEPANQDPDTVALVAQLTVQYVSQLVDAAVDAHDLLTDGAGGVLPPPPVPHKRVPPRPPPPTATNKPISTATFKPEPQKRKRSDEDYWDDPLPEPKIRTHKPSQSVQANLSALAAEGPSSLSSPHVPVDEWVGVSGVDFWETSRSRVPHVATPSAIGTQCFIFPVCHDAGLYGRVMEVQAARRSIEPVLLDNVWMDLVRKEGGRLGKSAVVGAPMNDDEDADQDENQDADHRAMWPGLESLLPIHRGDNG